ncbi:MAG TPA: 4-hydroxy-tetrahydrodipicolinate reductase [Longimicrobiales bacterium]|nr:4-hydroxy-tetrahydrodipicolinate reductase [Longimicrobiales bacterium]
MALAIAVSGITGRMGRAVAALIRESPDLRLVGGIARSGGADASGVGADGPVTPEAAGGVVAAADAVIDFSAPEQLSRLLDAQAAVLPGKALVVGTTGLGEGELDRLRRSAERCPVLVAANFSVGVNVLEALVAAAARALPMDRFDVEIVEAHHRRKQDAPSGTALMLGRAVAEARGQRLEEVRRDGRSGRGGERPVGEIGFHALRGGDVIGEHTVSFLGQQERLELRHAAMDRSLFAEGALLAARWLVGRQPGWYTMREVLDLP